MQALKVRQKVVDGQITLKVPEEFGATVEVIILGRLEDEIEFWNEDEIKNLGKTKTISPDFDTEDKSQEKAKSAKHKDFVYAVTDETREDLARAGLSEDEVLEDFNRFRRKM